MFYDSYYDAREYPDTMYLVRAADPYTGTLHGYQMLMQVVGCGGWRVYQLAAGVYAQTRLLMTSKKQSVKSCIERLTHRH